MVNNNTIIVASNHDDIDISSEQSNPPLNPITLPNSRKIDGNSNLAVTIFN